MLSLKEQIQNLQTILSSQQNLTSENKQLLNKEITRLKQELAKQKDLKHSVYWTNLKKEPKKIFLLRVALRDSSFSSPKKFKIPLLSLIGFFSKLFAATTYSIIIKFVILVIENMAGGSIVSLI